ncbi:MAG: cupin domain-containing protein [Syntrophobacterales bacterium]|nr:cupin domain-containing protein [Syntrophobacterales bacterium]
MIAMNARDVFKTRVETITYKGRLQQVKDVWIQWLSKAGPEAAPDYGLRFFTVGPGGEVPIHSHSYYQTTYVLSGRLLVVSYDENDKATGEKVLGPHDFVYLPTLEPHSMKNASDTEECTFLCSIANIRE